MPSLRRTFSSPGRSSPYSSMTQTRTGARSPRRSSGSDTSNRRILADIDWWRVEEGQREVRGLASHDQLRQTTPLSDDEELDQEEREPVPVAGALVRPAPAHNTAANVDAPLWHNVPGAGWDTFDGLDQHFRETPAAESFEMPSALEQFAALSLNPLGRATLHRSVSSSSTFSDMSFSSDSSYSTPTLSPTGLSLGFEDFGSAPLDDSDDDNEPPFAALSHATRRPSAPTFRSGRSVSYSFVESDLSFTRGRSDWLDEDEESSAGTFSQSITDSDDLFF